MLSAICYNLQRSPLFCAPGLVKFVPAVARLFCTALLGSFLNMLAQNKGDLCRANNSNVEGLEVLAKVLFLWSCHETKMREREKEIELGAREKTRGWTFCLLFLRFFPGSSACARACTRTCSLPCCLSGLLSARCARSPGKSAFVCVYVLKSFCGMRMPGRVRSEGGGVNEEPDASNELPLFILSCFLVPQY